MATLQAGDIADMVIATLHKYMPGFHQITQDLQDYEMMGRWLKGDAVKVGSGQGIREQLLAKRIGAARHVGLYEEDDVNVGDHLAQLTVPWVHAETKWGYDVRETFMNKGPEEICNMVFARETAAEIDLAEELEERSWAYPTTTQDEYPYGLPYYVVYNATTGFNGGLAGSHTTKAGVNITTYPKYKNYTAQYTNLTKADLIKKMRTAHRKIRFKSPVGIQEFRGAKGNRFRIYVDETTISGIEDLGTAQNDNLGPDIAQMDGTMVFKGHPIVWVPYLDDNAASGSNPVYMIDHTAFKVVVLRENYMRRTGPQRAAKQHNVYEVFRDLSYNFCCTNLRSCALIAKSDPFS
jgi:hypothetical protein